MFWFVMYVNESIKSTHHERVCFQGSNSMALFTFKKLYFSSCSRFGAHIGSTVILTNYEHTHKATTRQSVWNRFYWQSKIWPPICAPFSTKSYTCILYVRPLLSFWVTTPLQLQSFPLSSFFIRRMLKLRHFSCKSHGFCTLSHFGPHIWNSLPQDIRHSAILSSFKSKQDISLLRIFQLSNIVLYPYQSVQRVCACVCASFTVMLEPLSVW